MRPPNPPVSPKPPSKPEPDQPKGSDPGRYAPIWLLLFALFLIFVAMYVLLSGPVARKVAALQPTATYTPLPTETPTITPTFTRTPTRTPVPTLTPEPRPVYDPALDIHTIRMVNEQIGWGSGGRALWRTADGGQTWKDITPLEVSPGAAGMTGFFLDTLNAWYLVPVGAADSELGKLYQTGDGGLKWTSTEVDFGLFGTGLFFLDKNHGWVLTTGRAYARRVLSTDDGGLTWKSVHLVSNEPGDQSGILPVNGGAYGPIYTSVSHGWVITTGFFTEPGPTLYETTDGGRIWQPRTLGLAKDEIVRYFTFPRFFGPSGQDGVLAVNTYNGANNQTNRWVFLITSDGGETWDQVAPVDVSMLPITTTVLVSFSSNQDFFVYVPGGKLYYSQDSGRSWTETVPGFLPAQSGTALQVDLTGMSFVSPKVGFLWTTSGGTFQLFKTIAGGAVWQEIKIVAETN